MSNTFLSDLFRLICQLQAARGSDGVDVAFLGNVLRREGKDWASHGFGRLSAALAVLEEQKQVSVFQGEKGALRVRALGEAEVPAKAVELSNRPSTAVFQPLRSPIWFAFAAGSAAEKRKLVNRRTGAVWFYDATPPAPELDWVLVEPVPEENQKAWARDFIERLDGQTDKNVLRQALEHADWFRRFPAELEKVGPVQVRSWSQTRSAGIIEQVKAWAQKNNVPEEVLFANFRAPRRRELSLPEVAGRAPSTDLREALLDAIRRMPTDDLLSLPIPARLLIQSIRPDLLR